MGSPVSERRKGDRQNSPPMSSKSRSTSRRRVSNGRRAGGPPPAFSSAFTGTLPASVMRMVSFLDEDVGWNHCFLLNAPWLGLDASRARGRGLLAQSAVYPGDSTVRHWALWGPATILSLPALV